MPADRANDQEVFLTLEDVMKEKCLDHVTTMVGIDEKTIEEDFKAVDTDEDGKVTLEEGLKVYEYLRETVQTASIQKCLYTCCPTSNDDYCRLFGQVPKVLTVGNPPSCKAKFEQHIEPNPEEVCTLTAATACNSPRPDDCETNPYSIQSGEEEISFSKVFAEG